MAKSQEEVFQIVYNGLIFVGMILSIVALFIDSKSNANLYISSYTFISAGIILLIGFLIHKILKNPNASNADFFFCILIKCWSLSFANWNSFVHVIFSYFVQE